MVYYSIVIKDRALSIFPNGVTDALLNDRLKAA